MKITIVAGARPNFMKIAPITRAIEAARALGEVVLKGSFHLLRVQLVENAHAAFLVAYRYGFTVWHFAFPPSYEIWIA